MTNDVGMKFVNNDDNEKMKEAVQHLLFAFALLLSSSSIIH
jgi:hypothetical protein